MLKNRLILPKPLQNRCRCCLNTKKDLYYPLSSVLPDLATTNNTVIDVLRTVTNSKIEISKDLPSDICQSCLKGLVAAFSFITIFQNSQIALQEEQACQIGGNIRLLVPQMEEIIVLTDTEYIQEESHKVLNNEPTGSNSITIMTLDLKPTNSVETKGKFEVKKNDSKEQIGVYPCNICNTVYNSKFKLQHHNYRNHNPNWRERFKCNVCALECKTPSALKHHEEVHKSFDFKCEMCPKMYKNRAKLRAHIKSSHEIGMSHLCSKCGRSFKSQSALTYHLKCHSNQRNYMCGYCGFKTLVLGALKRHERTHTGERPYVCSICGKAFAGATDRIKHENIHKGILPHKCSYCDKRFGQKYNKMVHMLQHGGEYRCDYCNNSFIDQTVLDFHNKRNHRVISNLVTHIEVQKEEQESDDVTEN
ncbi:hypothetical protein ABEB36_001009 [Hypothenemus hampei]|uniref:Uncharacterized protein n=1 Tax=Hypothenemus hampei TaxID=57062 RepID=A0ABD1FD58_HYPHA